MSVKKRTSYSRDDYYQRREHVSFGVKRHKVSLYVDAFVAERELRGVAAATSASYRTELGMFASWITRRSLRRSVRMDAAIDQGVSRLRPTSTSRRGGRMSQMIVRSYASRLLAFLRWLHEEQDTVTDLAKSIHKQGTQAGDRGVYR